MGSEVGGPGAGAPGPLDVAAPVARAWAVAAAAAAVRVPAANAEADAWIVRGWADVAVGCVALDGPGFAGPRLVARQDGPGAFSGLDEVVTSERVASGAQHAARLRYLRRFAGPVPPWYPDARPVAGPIRGLGSRARRAAALVAEFGELLIAAAARLPDGTACPLVSAQQLAWGARYRPSPSDEHVTLRLPAVNRRLARRTWMCLPGLPSPGTAIAEVPSTATPMAQQIWRGIHEGAHLDHLSSLGRLGRSPAPNPGEFGAGLLVAESYAMAVEILAAVECLLAGEGHAVSQLGAGLIERATRLPGGSNPTAEFAELPTLAEVYVLGPLEVLADGPAAAALPAEMASSLRYRWRSACTAYPPAAAFGSAAAEVVGWPLLAGPPCRTSLVSRARRWPAGPPEPPAS